MFHAAITGTGRAAPSRVLTNADLEKMVETTDEWITTRTGIRERRMAGEGDVLTDFCLEASKQALEAGGVAPEALDAIMVATVSPDQPIPAAACILQQKLGAKRVASWDINAACSGWLYGVHIADALIQTGKAKNILLVGAEFLTRYVDYTDRSTCVLFGDGAGATLLTATKADHGVLATSIRCDGEGAQFIAMPGGGSSFPANRPETLGEKLPFIRMMGGETFKMAVRSMTEVCKGGPFGERLHLQGRQLGHSAPGQRADHHGGGRPARGPARALHREHRPVRQHERRLDPDRPRRDGARREDQEGGPHPLHRVRRRADVGRGPRPLVSR
jgi:3-oxoacyl-[acyl-carrier-protein] synthase-3